MAATSSRLTFFQQLPAQQLQQLGEVRGYAPRLVALPGLLGTSSGRRAMKIATAQAPKSIQTGDRRLEQRALDH